MKNNLIASNHAHPRRPRETASTTRYSRALIKYIKLGVIKVEDIIFIHDNFRHGRGFKTEWDAHDLGKKERIESFTDLPPGRYSSIRAIPGSNEYKIIYEVTKTHVHLLFLGKHDDAYNFISCRVKREQLAAAI
jgi:hypothetical protein